MTINSRSKPAPGRDVVAAQIHVMRGRNMPFAEIARRLGLTKNQAIGVAHRTVRPEGVPAPMSRLVVPRPPKPVPQLWSNECNWPHGNPGDPDFHFCGAPRNGDPTYCSEHRARSGGGQPRAPSAVVEQLFAKRSRAA